MSDRYGVRADDGAIHYGFNQGDAENLAAQNCWQLVIDKGNGWEDVEDERFQ